jgi:hypothetical protein
MGSLSSAAATWSATDGAAAAGAARCAGSPAGLTASYAAAATEAELIDPIDMLTSVCGTTDTVEFGLRRGI